MRIKRSKFKVKKEEIRPGPEKISAGMQGIFGAAAETGNGKGLGGDAS
jgi:hypothetical protein